MPVTVRFRALTVNSKQIRTAELEGAARLHMVNWGNSVIDRVRDYPPIPPQSTYIRTMELFRGWRLAGPRSLATGLVMDVVNVATNRYGKMYMRYVQGAFQRSFHRAHGWKNIFDYLDRDGYVRGLQDVIRRHIRY